MRLNDKSLLKNTCYINCEWITDSESKFNVINPANGCVVASVTNAGFQETETVVQVADNAFKTWRDTPAKQRGVLLRRWYELIMDTADDLGTIITMEQGKPLQEAISEVSYGASFIEYYAEEGKRVAGDTLPTIAADRRLLTSDVLTPANLLP